MMRFTYQELTGMARGAVDAVEAVAERPLGVIVVLAETRDDAGEVGRFAAESNYENPKEIARALRDTAAIFEAL